MGFIKGFAVGNQWPVEVSQADMVAMFRRPQTTLRRCIARVPGEFTSNRDNWSHFGKQQERIAVMEQRQEIVDAEMTANRKLTRPQLRQILKEKYNIEVSESTLFYDLHAGFFAWRPRRVIPFDKDPEKWRETRLDFARHWLSIIRSKRAQGIRVHFVFTDESIFRCSPRKGLGMV